MGGTHHIRDCHRNSVTENAFTIRMKMRSMICMLLIATSMGCASSRPEASLRDIKTKAMDAGYRGDLDALQVAATNADALAIREPRYAGMAHYWAGYSRWQRAINGVNHASRPEEIRKDLDRAMGDFEAALAAQPDFADADLVLGLIHGWLILMDEAHMRDHVVAFRAHLAHAKQLQPRNPRVIWADATNLLGAPREFGGDPERALRLFAEVPAAASKYPRSSTGPEWGAAESYMSTAYALATSKDGDAIRARRAADAALALVPNWWYVRETLLPMIEAKRGKSTQ